MAVHRHSRHSSRDLKAGRKNDNAQSLVYDPTKERLSIEIVPEDRKNDYTTCECPGRNNHVEIFVPIGGGTSKTQSLIARVDLSKLGWTERIHRHLKEDYTQTILVKGKVPEPNTCERGTWPIFGAKSGLDIPYSPLSKHATR